MPQASIYFNVTSVFLALNQNLDEKSESITEYLRKPHILLTAQYLKTRPCILQEPEYLCWSPWQGQIPHPSADWSSPQGTRNSLLLQALWPACVTLPDQIPVLCPSFFTATHSGKSILHICPNTAKCCLGTDLTPDLQTSAKRSHSHRSSKAIFSSIIHFTCKSFIMSLIPACF